MWQKNVEGYKSDPDVANVIIVICRDLGSPTNCFIVSWTTNIDERATTLRPGAWNNNICVAPDMT